MNTINLLSKNQFLILSEIKELATNNPNYTVINDIIKENSTKLYFCDSRKQWVSKKTIERKFEKNEKSTSNKITLPVLINNKIDEDFKHVTLYKVELIKFLLNQLVWSSERYENKIMFTAKKMMMLLNSEYKQIVKYLVDNNIISFQKNKIKLENNILAEIYIYSINKEYLNCFDITLELSTNEFNKRINNYFTQNDTTLQQLIKMSQRGFIFENNEILGFNNNYKFEKELYKKDTYSGRYHSFFSQTKKENRRDLMIYNKNRQIENVNEIDFSNSAPYHFYYFLLNQSKFNKMFDIKTNIIIKKEYKEELKEGHNQAVKGNFYEYILKNVGEDIINQILIKKKENLNTTARNKTKLVCQYLFFGMKNDISSKLIQTKLPGLVDALDQMKNTKVFKYRPKHEQHKTSSWLMQKVELYFVKKIINKLFKLGYNIQTIHDSFLCANSEVEEIKNIIKEVYKEENNKIESPTLTTLKVSYIAPKGEKIIGFDEKIIGFENSITKRKKENKSINQILFEVNTIKKNIKQNDKSI